MTKLFSIIALFLLSCSCAFGQAIGPQWFLADRAGQTNDSAAECDRPANVAVSSGLTITAKLQTVQCGNATAGLSTYSYTAAHLITNTFSFTYGLVHFNGTFYKGGTGLTSIVWLEGANCWNQIKLNFGSSPAVGACSYPNPGSEEQDIAEVDSGQGSTQFFQGMHTTNGVNSCTATVTNNIQHDFEHLWTVGSSIFYIDGVQTCSISGAFVPSTPEFLMVDLGVGGTNGGTVTETLPVSISFSFIRVCAASVGEGNCTQANTALTMNSSTGSGFDEEFTGTGPLSSVYVSQTYQGNATGLDCADSFGILNNAQPWWTLDAGFWTNGQIGAGTAINLCGSITSRPTANGSGTSGSPINFNFQSGASGSCPNPNGFNFIGVTGQNCNANRGGWQAAQ